MSTRHAGLIVPLFSAASSSSWGVGELPDLVPLARWMAAGGFDRVMLLPLGRVPEGEASPYSAASTLAIDPVYVSLAAVDDFQNAGGVDRLSPEGRELLAAARPASRVAYDLIRRVKREALDLAFATFLEHDWTTGSARAQACAAFIDRQQWWLADDALFEALTDEQGTADWNQWPSPLRHRVSSALDESRVRLAPSILRAQYVQWLAAQQWESARQAARALGVSVFGDLPFVARASSADVWSQARAYRLSLAAGAPPDAFSDDGQNWGLPAYDWKAAAASDFAVMRTRARRMTDLYDGFRIDHLVGLYRTYVRSADGHRWFTPVGEEQQLPLGERVVSILREAGAEVLAEDLGSVPDFVRASITRLQVPGCRVLRWERAWHAPGQPFLDPTAFPSLSVALTGTHDTETLADWWDHAGRDERQASLAMPALGQAAGTDPDQSWNETLHAALLEVAWTAGSSDLFVPIQDLFGWRDRVNTPGTISADNWTWRLPWPADALLDEAESGRVAGVCRDRSARASRATALFEDW